MKFIRGFILFGLLCGFGQFGYGQDCASGCRFSTPVFDSLDIFTHKFGEGKNADGNNQELFLDMYLPKGDTASLRPVVIFAFGGGFIQGDRFERHVTQTAEYFAHSGYACAAIDYRIGFSIQGIFPNPIYELMRVFFRAMQDMRASIQWVRAHAAQMGNPYRLDTNRIFIGGASAGAITALMVAYCDKETEMEEVGDLVALAPLGGFNSSSGLYPQYSWEVDGVLNIAGALPNKEWIEAGDPPLISAHGDQDGTVPYQGGNFNLGFAQLGFEGSFLVHQEAQKKGVCSYLHTIVGGGHPSNGAPDTYYNDIYLRAVPRLAALAEGKTYCCPLKLSVSPDTILEVQVGQTVDLMAQASGGPSNLSYHWCSMPCGTDINGPTLQVSPDSMPAYYLATVTANNCVDVAYVRFDSLQSIHVSDPVFDELQVAPHPVQGLLRVQGLPLQHGNAVVKLFALNGQQVFAAQPVIHSGAVRLALPADLDRGNYILEVFLPALGKRSFQRILVQ